MKINLPRFNSVKSTPLDFETLCSKRSNTFFSDIRHKCSALAKSVFQFNKKAVAQPDLLRTDTTKEADSGSSAGDTNPTPTKATTTVVRLKRPKPHTEATIKKLCTAACAGRIEEIKELLSLEHIDPNAVIRDPVSREKIPALLFAIKRGQTEAALVFLKSSKVDPTIDHNKALEEAVKMNNKRVVRALLHKLKANPLRNIETAMRTAVTNRNERILNMLIDHPSSKSIDMGTLQAFQITAARRPEILARRLMAGGETGLGMAILEHDKLYPHDVDSKPGLVVRRLEL